MYRTRYLFVRQHGLPFILAAASALGFAAAAGDGLLEASAPPGPLSFSSHETQQSSSPSRFSSRQGCRVRFVVGR